MRILLVVILIAFADQNYAVANNKFDYCNAEIDKNGPNSLNPFYTALKTIPMVAFGTKLCGIDGQAHYSRFSGGVLKHECRRDSRAYKSLLNHIKKFEEMSLGHMITDNKEHGLSDQEVQLAANQVLKALGGCEKMK